MNSKPIFVFGVLIVVVICTMHNGYAADAGDPYTAASIKNVQVEFIYEKYDRDVELSESQFTATGPGGVIPFTVSGESGSQEEDRFMARLSLPAGNKMVIYLDGGITDSKDSVDPVAIFGGGLRVLAYESETVNATVFGSLHYVPEIEYKLSEFDVDLGRGDFTQKESYWEANGGVNLSHSFPLGEGAALTPYGGIMISVLQGDEDFEAIFPDVGVTVKGSGDLEDDGVVGLFGGVAFKFSDNLGVRIEGRFLNQTSISAALSLNL